MWLSKGSHPNADRDNMAEPVFAISQCLFRFKPGSEVAVFYAQ
jgi:hypothetical protein